MTSSYFLQLIILILAQLNDISLFNFSLFNAIKSFYKGILSSTTNYKQKCLFEPVLTLGLDHSIQTWPVNLKSLFQALKRCHQAILLILKNNERNREVLQKITVTKFWKYFGRQHIISTESLKILVKGFIFWASIFPKT